MRNRRIVLWCMLLWSIPGASEAASARAMVELPAAWECSFSAWRLPGRALAASLHKVPQKKPLWVSLAPGRYELRWRRKGWRHKLRVTLKAHTQMALAQLPRSRLTMWKVATPAARGLRWVKQKIIGQQWALHTASGPLTTHLLKGGESYPRDPFTLLHTDFFDGFPKARELWRTAKLHTMLGTFFAGAAIASVTTGVVMRAISGEISTKVHDNGYGQVNGALLLGGVLSGLATLGLYVSAEFYMRKSIEVHNSAVLERARQIQLSILKKKPRKRSRLRSPRILLAQQ